MWLKIAASVLLTGLTVLACRSSATPEDCAAAGGQCVIDHPGTTCTKLGPANTCNCNPDCNPAGSYCCLDLVAGDAAAPVGVGK